MSDHEADPLIHAYEDQLSEDWRKSLLSVSSQIESALGFLDLELDSGRQFLPEHRDIFRAFHQPISEVKILIVGQDPYPTLGHAMGLSFSVKPNVRPLPRSLQNIYTELSSDLGYIPVGHGDLSRWSDQGVMLLNRVLSVEVGKPGSHRGIGWEEVTDEAIRALVRRSKPLVAILWGKDALKLQSLLGSTPTVISAHPSPLSAHRGFFGSRPFSQANELLRAQGASPVDWSLPVM